VVKSLAAMGKTVLLTTHYMDEAQHLADRVAIVAAGRIVAAGDPATLGGRDTARAIVRYRVPAGVQPPAELGVAADGAVELVPDDLARALHRLSGWAIEHDVSLDDLQILRPSLEDIYLQLTDGS
jgi:ABC-2 type transport system ATP-binding protein